MAYTPVNRILLGAVAPVAIYYGGMKLGYPLSGALAASVWSMCLMGWFLLRERELDGFSAIGAAYGVSELAGLVVTQDPEWFLLSPVVSDWVLGGVFLLSMLLARPLIQILAEQSAGADAFPEEVRQSPYFRSLWMRLSLVWGGAYILKGGLALAVLTTAPEDIYLVVRTVLGWPTIMVLIAFSFWYPKRYWQRVLS